MNRANFNPSLTSARFFAALLVFLYHASASSSLVSHEFKKNLQVIFSVAGYFGVSFFFILSGFILTKSYKYSCVRDFYIKRVAKIFPLHLFTMLVAAVAINYSKPLLPGGTNVSGLFENIFLMHAWSPNPYVFISMNGVSWTLSCEAFFYLAFPFLALFFNNKKTTVLIGFSGVILIIVILLPFISYFIHDSQKLPWKDYPVILYWFFNILPLTRALEFTEGIIICILFNRGVTVKLQKLNVAIVVFILFYFISILFSNEVFKYASFNIIPVILIILSLSGNCVYVLFNPILIKLGELSFAFYMIHRLIIMYSGDLIVRYFNISVGSTLHDVYIIIAWFLLSLLSSYLLYNLLELPMIKIIKTIFIKKRVNNEL